MKRFIRSVTMFAIAILPVSSVQAANWTIDSDHSSVEFKVRHLIGKVKGSFGKFSGTFSYEEGKPETWKAEAIIETASLDTNVKERDKHLRSKDFFWVKKHKTMTFKMTKVVKYRKKKGTVKLHGELTLRGITKPVVLDVEISGIAKDPWGNTKSAFTATTTINRKDFGLKWNEVLETGGVLVGEKVDITLEIEGNLKEESKAAKK